MHCRCLPLCHLIHNFYCLLLAKINKEQSNFFIKNWDNLAFLISLFAYDIESTDLCVSPLSSACMFNIKNWLPWILHVSQHSILSNIQNLMCLTELVQLVAYSTETMKFSSSPLCSVRLGLISVVSVTSFFLAFVFR